MVNMTPDFYNFFRNALEILGLKSWGLLTLCVFTVDVASVGRFPIEGECCTCLGMRWCWGG